MMKKINPIELKPMQIDAETHEIIRLDAARQSSKPNTVVFMRDVIAQCARKLNKKYKYIK